MRHYPNRHIFRTVLFIIFSACCVTMAATPATAETPAVSAPSAVATYIPAAGSTVEVTGKSTFHDWSVTSHALEGKVLFSHVLQAKSAAIPALESIDLTIPVKTLKGSDGSGMTNQIMHSLHRRKHPNIMFILTRAQLLKVPIQKNQPGIINTQGLLKINGMMRTEKLTLKVFPHVGGKLTIKTSIKLKMTDFGVKPPTAMFGIIRSGNTITVTATWQLSRRG